jgi:hypothetical protein
MDMYKIQKLITDKTGKQTMIYIEGPDPSYVQDLYHEATVQWEDMNEAEAGAGEEVEVECPHCGSDDIAQDIDNEDQFYCLEKDCKKTFHL